MECKADAADFGLEGNQNGKVDCFNTILVSNECRDINVYISGRVSNLYPSSLRLKKNKSAITFDERKVKSSRSVKRLLRTKILAKDQNRKFRYTKQISTCGAHVAFFRVTAKIKDLNQSISCE